ncbi:thioredoxin [Massilibacteroides sp.]|uniref:thioredoxin n=1 Tax=Massilibacteroides sp. TaxID=2034766 RepID=UPI0026392213|nr:thioredoxin [Massilibacteroides sp.]MDD4515259.1 thioredoxin [Massilibacteroides sp.]
MKNLRIVFFLITAFTFANSFLRAQTEEETGKVIVLDKATFLNKIYNYEKNQDEWIYEGTKPCIVDFYADWCGPCRQVSPILKQLAKEYKDQIIVYKVNVDNEKELASAFGIQSIPTILFIPKSGQPQLAMGAFPKETFEKQIKEFLLKQDGKSSPD